MQQENDTRGLLRRASDAFFATIQRRNNAIIVEVLVPVEYNKTNVVIITADNTILYQPDKAWHEYRRQHQNKIKRKGRPHKEECDHMFDIMLKEYYSKAKERLRTGKSRRITKHEENLMRTRYYDRS